MLVLSFTFANDVYNLHAIRIGIKHAVKFTVLQLVGASHILQGQL